MSRWCCAQGVLWDCEKWRSYNLYFCPLLPVSKGYFSIDNCLITSPSLSTLTIFKPLQCHKGKAWTRPSTHHTATYARAKCSISDRNKRRSASRADTDFDKPPFCFSSVNAFVLLLESRYRYQNNSSPQEFRGIPSQLIKEGTKHSSRWLSTIYLSQISKNARKFCSYRVMEKEPLSSEASGTT